MFDDWQPCYDFNFVMDFSCTNCKSWVPEGYDCPWCAFLGNNSNVNYQLEELFNIKG